MIMRSNRRNPLVCTLPVVLLSLVLSGCVENDGEFTRIRDTVLAHFGGGCETEVQFSVGSLGIALSRLVVGKNHNTEGVDDILKEASHVQLGVYSKVAQKTSGFEILGRMEADMLENGWKSILRSRRHGEMIAVYCRTHPDECMRQLLVLSSDDDKIMLIEVEGDLGKMIHHVVRNRRFEPGM